MLVRDWMTKNPLIVSPDTPIEKAIRIMRSQRIRHLPVIREDETIAGIVTQTDLLQASPSPATSLSVWEINFLLARMQVRDAMTRKVIVVSEECPLEEAAMVMAQNKIGCLPVVHGRRLVGIITETDLFNIFTEQLGVRRSGVRLVLVIEDARGVLSRIAGLIAAAGGNIVRLTSLPADDPAHQVVTIKVEDATRDMLMNALSDHVVEIRDVRDAPGWDSSEFSPYHWTLEA
ncbi:MAG TPA: CBS domain-containing protein [Anaerolineae bacterium]|nr:CBS domain-containing protein [Anaerolineae bacterium]